MSKVVNSSSSRFKFLAVSNITVRLLSCYGRNGDSFWWAWGAGGGSPLAQNFGAQNSNIKIKKFKQKEILT